MILFVCLMETCLSGLRYLLAKEAGFNRPREFESRRLRNKIIMSFSAIMSMEVWSMILYYYSNITHYAHYYRNHTFDTMVTRVPRISHSRRIHPYSTRHRNNTFPRTYYPRRKSTQIVTIKNTLS
jgi:hypothetical protein